MTCKIEACKLFKLALKSDTDKKELERCFQYPMCELEYDFLGFEDNYLDLTYKIPSDFTIVDIGCYQGIQSILFKEFKEYIGVEPWVECEWRFHTNNSKYIQNDWGNFKNSPDFKELNLEKTFAICSAVPSTDVREDIPKYFKYFRVAYPGEITVEHFPVTPS